MKSMFGILIVALTLGFGPFGCASTGTTSGSAGEQASAGGDCCDKSTTVAKGDCDGACDKSKNGECDKSGDCDKSKKADCDGACDKSKEGACCGDGAVAAQAASTDMVGQKVTCPVSGKEFTVEATSPQATHDGVTHTFCCGGCKTKFEANPAAFIAN